MKIIITKPDNEDNLEDLFGGKHSYWDVESTSAKGMSNPPVKNVLVGKPSNCFVDNKTTTMTSNQHIADTLLNKSSHWYVDNKQVIAKTMDKSHLSTKQRERVRDLIFHAETYYEKGIYCVNVLPRFENGKWVAAKGPRECDWWNKKLPPTAMYARLNGYIEDCPENLSILCGSLSGGLVVVDVDSEAAQKTWPIMQKHFRLSTGMVSGRGSDANVRGHYYYKCPELDESRTYRHPGQGTHIDFLSTKACAMAPPSIHPVTGEEVCWKYDFINMEPEVVDPMILQKAVRMSAAAALISEHYDPAVKDTFYRQMNRAGYSKHDIDAFLEAADLASPRFGFPFPIDLLGVIKIKEWMGIDVRESMAEYN